MSESSSSTVCVMLNQNILKKSPFFYIKKKSRFFKEEKIIQKKISDYIFENKILNIDFLKIILRYEFNVWKVLEMILVKSL